MNILMKNSSHSVKKMDLVEIKLHPNNSPHQIVIETLHFSNCFTQNLSVIPRTCVKIF